MFNELLNLIQKEVVYLIYKVNFGIQLAPSVMNRRNNLVLSGAETESVPVAAGKMKDDAGKVIGRNDLCPCGSGKKYKRCHGA